MPAAKQPIGPPKFGPGVNGQGPVTVRDWEVFYRWLSLAISTPATPYLLIGGAKYVPATMFAATLPSASPSWINSVTPASTSAGANGNLLIDAGGNAVFAFVTAAASVEMEYNFQSKVTVNTAVDIGGGPWLWDSTNNYIYSATVGIYEGAGGYTPFFVVEQRAYNNTGNPGAPSNVSTVYALNQQQVYHMKLSVSGGTLSAQISMDGGATYTTFYTQSVGTISKAGYFTYANSLLNVFSFSAN